MDKSVLSPQRFGSNEHLGVPGSAIHQTFVEPFTASSSSGKPKLAVGITSEVIVWSPPDVCADRSVAPPYCLLLLLTFFARAPFSTKARSMHLRSSSEVRRRRETGFEVESTTTEDVWREAAEVLFSCLVSFDPTGVRRLVLTDLTGFFVACVVLGVFVLQVLVSWVSRSAASFAKRSACRKTTNRID